MRLIGVSRDEFAAFYAASKDRCLSAALAHGMSPPDAEDAVSDAFARAWGSWRSVRKCDSPTAWVVRAAINSNISRWRKTRRETDKGHRLEEATESSSSEQSIELLAAIRGLPPRQRDVVVLRYLLDLDSAATARWLGISQGTVGAHLHHALKSLRTILVEPNGAP